MTWRYTNAEAVIATAETTSAAVNIERSLRCRLSIGLTIVPPNPPMALAPITSPSTQAGSPSARNENPNWKMAKPTAARSAIMSQTAPPTSGCTSSTMASTSIGSIRCDTRRTCHAATAPAT